MNDFGRYLEDVNENEYNKNEYPLTKAGEYLSELMGIEWVPKNEKVFLELKMSLEDDEGNISSHRGSFLMDGFDERTLNKNKALFQELYKVCGYEKIKDIQDLVGHKFKVSINIFKNKKGTDQNGFKKFESVGVSNKKTESVKQKKKDDLDDVDF